MSADPYRTATPISAEVETADGYATRVLVHDPEIPGLTQPSVEVVEEIRKGDWVFCRLLDGGLFVEHLRGDQMVGYALFTPAEAAEIRKALGG